MMLPMKRRQNYGGGYAKRPNVQSGGPHGDPRSWNPQQVHDWIISVAPKGGEVFAREFLENDINGGDMVDLNQDDFFQQFDHVTNAFAKKKLWKGIAKLKSGAKFPPAPDGGRPNGGGNAPNPRHRMGGGHEGGYRQERPEPGLHGGAHRGGMSFPPEREKVPPPRNSWREPPPERQPWQGEPPQQHRDTPPWERNPGHDGGGRPPAAREPLFNKPPPSQQFGGPPGNTITTGCVKQFLKDRNYGFIAETDTLKDVYFHGSQFRGPNLNKIQDGDLLRFTIVKSKKGWEAHDITPIKATQPKPRVAGFVQKHMPGSAFGDIYDNAGYTIFFKSKDADKPLAEGDYVTFEVMNTVRRPRALQIKKMDNTRGRITELRGAGGTIIEDNNLTVRFAKHDCVQGEQLSLNDYVQFSVSRDHAGIYARNVTKKVDPKYAPKPRDYVGTSRGVVTNFYPDKQYGFIKDLTNGETIFVHEDALQCDPPTLIKDDFVQFDVAVVKKGYKASNVKKMELPKPRGKITFYNADRRFGYCRERQGVDLFFHIKQCEDRPKEPEVGDIVEFDVEGSHKGPMAVNVTWEEPDEELDADAPLAKGEIKELRQDHGFITQETGGPDAYFLMSDTDQENPPEVGSSVEYAVLPTGKGPKAFNIKLADNVSVKPKQKKKVVDGPSHGSFKCFYPAKQIGFVTDHIGVDIFFRRTDFVGSSFDVQALIGKPVTFVIKSDHRGPSAVLIKAEGDSETPNGKSKPFPDPSKANDNQEMYDPNSEQYEEFEEHTYGGALV